MFKKIRMTFILIAMITMILTISVFYLAITYSNYKKAVEKADTLTKIISDNRGNIPEYTDNYYTSKDKEFITPESEFSTRYAVIFYNKDENSFNKDLTHIASINEKETEEIAKELINSKKDKGFYKNLRYRITDTNEGKMVVLLDYRGELQYLRYTTNRGILIIIFGLICVFVIISILSNGALKPMENNLEKQKQFVTNAGHDLKTPIAVILANVEVLQMTLGEENEWVNSIKKQAIKMDKLTKGLLNMAKVENGNFKPEKVEFSITQMVDDEVKDFKALANGKNITLHSDGDVKIFADKNMTRQLVVILIDNAIKYADTNGNIDIYLSRNKKQTKIEVINDYSNYKDFNGDRVFDRFYRGDKSRNNEKNLGYGIGLSMAKSIVDSHNGKIEAYLTKENRVEFEVRI